MGRNVTFDTDSGELAKLKRKMTFIVNGFLSAACGDSRRMFGEAPPGGEGGSPAKQRVSGSAGQQVSEKREKRRTGTCGAAAALRRIFDYCFYCALFGIINTQNRARKIRNGINELQIIFRITY